MRVISKNQFFIAALTALGLVACGGSSSGGGGTTPNGTGPAVTPDGETVTLGTGETVQQEAFDAWEEAKEMFTRNEESGWNPGNCASAVEKFEEAIQAQPRFAEAQYMAGITHQRCGDQESANRMFNSAVSSDGQLCEAITAQGLVHLNAGRNQPAQAAFQRATRVPVEKQCAEAYLNLAITQLRAGGAQVEQARQSLRRALAIDSSYLPAFNQLALVFLEEGKSDPQKLDLAEIVCRQAQLLEGDYAPIYNTWGLVKMERGDIIEALRFFNRAKELDNSMFQAFMNFGQVTLSFRGYRDAKGAFERAVQLNADDYDAHIGLGMAHRGLSDFDSAQAEYERAVQIDANRPEAYFNLGLLFNDYKSGQMADLEQAKRYFQQFTQKAGSRPQYADGVTQVNNRCDQSARGRRRRRLRRSDCRPGRIQNIDNTISALREVAEIERQAAAQQGGGES